MNLRALLEKQKELDNMILERAGIKEYPYTNVKLALLVELGELANEVQSFKHWKKNKNVNRERVVEEFADCLHFALSLENQLKQTPLYFLKHTDREISGFKKEFRDLINNIDMNDTFTKAYEYVVAESCILTTIIGLGISLDISTEEMEQAYLKKHEENIRRQQEGY